MMYLFRPVDHPTQSFLYTSTKKYFIGKHNSFQARNNTKLVYLKKKKNYYRKVICVFVSIFLNVT